MADGSCQFCGRKTGTGHVRILHEIFVVEDRRTGWQWWCKCGERDSKYYKTRQLAQRQGDKHWLKHGKK